MDEDFDGGDRPFTAEQVLREALATRARLSAELQVALAFKGGPLSDLLEEHKLAALNALGSLIDVSPQDANAISKLQEVVKLYLRDCEWVQGRLAEGAEADAEIKQIWGAEHDREGDGAG